MSLTRLCRTVLWVALGSTLACAPACSSGSGSNEASNALTSGVLQQGRVTSAALMQILSANADDWGWAGGVFDAPMADPNTTSAVAADAPFTFAWHADSTEPPAGPGAAGVSQASGLTGMAYLLVFSTPSNPKLLRVFTSEPTYTPDPAAWQALMTASGPITVALTTATFASDALTPQGGPHMGQTLVFLIGG